MDLAEITKKLAQSQVQETDALTAKYIEEAVKHITERGDKIEDYALVLVTNPAELKDSGLRVSMQYRIVPLEEVTTNE